MDKKIPLNYSPKSSMVLTFITFTQSLKLKTEKFKLILDELTAFSMTILPDLLRSGLNIVFCGTAAGNKSAERKAYYAGAGNLFYPTLAGCGLTPRLLKPSEFSELLNHNIGLTDLVKFHFGMDKDLRAEHYDIKSFENKILKYQPKIVCFNGKEAAKVYFELTKTSEVNYGLQHQMIGKTKLYVAPSTSLQAIAYWDNTIWNYLNTLIKNIDWLP